MSPVFIVLTSVSAAALIGIFLHHQNNHITKTHYHLESPRVKESFRIVHLSDLHNKQFRQGKLFRQVAALKPDIIVFTGDIISRWTQDRTYMHETVERLCAIAPVYFVPGNHEYGQGLHDVIFCELEAHGAIVLRHQFVNITVKGNPVTILGLDEVGYYVKSPSLLRRLYIWIPASSVSLFRLYARLSHL